MPFNEYTLGCLHPQLEPSYNIIVVEGTGGTIVALLFADGRSNRGNLNAATSAIRQADLQVYAVGIGNNIDVNELRSIASDPDDQHVFILRSYLDAAGFVDSLSVATCDGK